MVNDLKIKVSIEILGKDNSSSYNIFQELFKTAKEETLAVNPETVSIEEFQKIVKTQISDSLQATQKFIEISETILTAVKKDDPFVL